MYDALMDVMRETRPRFVFRMQISQHIFDRTEKDVFLRPYICHKKTMSIRLRETAPNGPLVVISITFRCDLASLTGCAKVLRQT